MSKLITQRGKSARLMAYSNEMYEVLKEASLFMDSSAADIAESEDENASLVLKALNHLRARAIKVLAKIDGEPKRVD